MPSFKKLLFDWKYFMSWFMSLLNFFCKWAASSNFIFRFQELIRIWTLWILKFWLGTISSLNICNINFPKVNNIQIIKKMDT